MAAKALAQVKDEDALNELLEETLNEGVSVRRVRERVKEMLKEGQDKSPRKAAKENSGEELTELKIVATQLAKSRKLIVNDKAKMKKVKKLLGQLRDLLGEIE